MFFIRVCLKAPSSRIKGLSTLDKSTTSISALCNAPVVILFILLPKITFLAVMFRRASSSILVILSGITNVSGFFFNWDVTQFLVTIPSENASITNYSIFKINHLFL